MEMVNTYVIYGLVILIVVCYLIYLYFIVKKTAPAQSQWKNFVEPKFREIDEIYNKYVLKDKKPSLFEKKDVRKVFSECRAEYKKYINICEESKIKLRMPATEFEEYIDKVENPLLSESELLDKELDRSKAFYNEAYDNCCICLEKLFNAKNDSEHIIEDVENFINTIALQPKSFEIEISKITIQKQQFKNACEYGTENQREVEKALKDTTSKLAVGGTIAAVSPNIALWVATTFGTSSTGVAISALSGAVQYNAAVAWLGGGAVAAGGGGMAAGQALLALAGPVGWGITGVSILSVIISLWRKHIKTIENKKNNILDMKKWTNLLKNMQLSINLQIKQIIDYSNNIAKMLRKCKKLKKCDYTAISDKDKYLLGTLVNNTKSLSLLLNKDLVETEG